MTDITSKLFLLIIVLACLLPAAAFAQQSRPAQEKNAVDSKTTRITLGNGSGTPGTSVVVPIYFTPAEGVDVAHLKLEVDFVSATLKFQKVQPGIAAEMGNVELKSSVKVGKNDKGLETSALTVEFEFSSGDPPKKGISAGLLGYITLLIGQTGRPASITLRAKVEGSELGSNKSLSNVRVRDAQVQIFATGTQPFVACFFFNH